MGKIVLEIEEFGKTHSEYKSFEQDRIRVGRAFSNDLIINDPFVSASHFSLKCVDGAWECEDNGSVNGTFVSNPNDSGTKTKIDKTCPISSGGMIYFGKTCIKLWDINQAVAPEQVLDNGSSFSFVPRNTAQSLILNFGVFSLVYFLQLSQWSWKRNDSFFKIAAEICLVLFCLVIWSAFWAVITRFTKRQHRFQEHLIFSFQWAVISVAVSFPLKYGFFFICNANFDYVVSMVFFSIFSVFILYNHLTIGTNLSFLKRIMIPSLITFFIIFLSVLAYFGIRNEFSPEPRHYINIVPLPKHFIPAIPVNDEIKRLDSIF